MCRDGWDMNRNSEQTIVMTKGRTQREHDEASFIQIIMHCWGWIQLCIHMDFIGKQLVLLNVRTENVSDGDARPHLLARPSALSYTSSAQQEQSSRYSCTTCHLTRSHWSSFSNADGLLSNEEYPHAKQHDEHSFQPVSSTTQYSHRKWPIDSPNILCTMFVALSISYRYRDREREEKRDVVIEQRANKGIVHTRQPT